MPRPVVHPCGTEAAYQRHRKRGEPTCRPCKDAHNEHRRESLRRLREEPRTGHDRATKAALEALARMHPKDFQVLYARALSRILSSS